MRAFLKVHMKIAVIGGGITGLTAAHELSKLGHSVDILEASDQIGGLAAGFPLNGTSLEKTYHHIFLTDRDIIDLVKELGIEATLLWRPSSIGCYENGKIYPFGTVTSLLSYSPLLFLSRIRLGIVTFYLQKTSRWSRFIHVPAAEWMTRWCGKSVFEHLWKPLLIGKFHHFYNRVSMAWLWARIHTRGRSKTNIFAKEKLGYFQGGFAVLIDNLSKAAKKNGVTMHTHASVRSLRANDEGKVQVQTESDSTAYDRVIATIPSSVFAKLIDGDSHVSEKDIELLRSIDYLGAVCFVFTSTQSLAEQYWTNVLDAGLPFLVFVQHTRLIDPSMYGGEHVYYAGTYLPHDHSFFIQSEDHVCRIMLEGVQKMFPHFDTSAVRQTFLFRLKNAQHVVDTDYVRKIPPSLSRLPGVYLANFSQIFPEDRGTNFAVREGRKIAALVLNGLPVNG